MNSLKGRAELRPLEGDRRTASGGAVQQSRASEGLEGVSASRGGWGYEASRGSRSSRPPKGRVPMWMKCTPLEGKYTQPPPGGKKIVASGGNQGFRDGMPSGVLEELIL